ncbi:MAG: 30S ribosomal protein S15 [Candidatus Diapherotrites archaeon]
MAKKALEKEEAAEEKAHGKASHKAAEGAAKKAEKTPKKAASKKAEKAGHKAEKEEHKAAEKKHDVEASSEPLEESTEKKPAKKRKGADRDFDWADKQERKRPAGKQVLDWVDYKPAELEQAIVNMANTGHTASQIGMMLRDQYGIPKLKKVAGVTVEDVLGKHNLLPEVPRDLLNLIRRSVTLQRHMKANKKDFTAKRGYQLTVSKIRRLVNYYHRKGKLPVAWRYTPETAALLVK